jgi:hypothetical protein
MVGMTPHILEEGKQKQLFMSDYYYETSGVTIAQRKIYLAFKTKYTEKYRKMLNLPSPPVLDSLTINVMKRTSRSILDCMKFVRERQ